MHRELLVLDAQGVLFNNPWSDFVDELATATNRRPSDVHRLWREVLHDDAWLGALNDEELWWRLTGERAEHGKWRGDLEARYRLGEVARYLRAWRTRVPIWILSNHRTEWLLDRLSRFGLTGHFDRVLVSDALGFMKPDPGAFREVIASVSTPAAALFVDDQEHNVDAARRLGMQSVLADDSASWLADVDRAIEKDHARLPA